MDLTLLNTKPAGPHVGGNINEVYFALASWMYTIPDRDSTNKAVISNNIVFKTGYNWELLYVTREKQKIVDKASGKRDNDNVTTTFTAQRPGLEERISQFVAEYGSEDFYLLLKKCGKTYPILMGRKCCPAWLDWEQDSGEGGDDDNIIKMTWVSTGPYPSAEYKGAFDPSGSVIAADDTTPDVADGSKFVTSANVAATEITDLDNPVVGSTVWIYGGSDTNSSTIADAGNFSLSAAMTLSLGSWIQLFVRADNDYVELDRG